MAAKIWCIYKITSPIGKIYIGKTVDFNRRVDSYRKKCEPKQRLLYRSFIKYGFENHNIEIIEEGILTNILSSDREKYWIREYKSNLNRWRQGIGLNLTDGGEGTVGLKHNRSKETAERVKKFRIEISGKPIIQYDLNGNIIKEFPAQRVAVKELGISRTTLKNILNNKTGYTYLGYTFKRKGEEFKIGNLSVGIRGQINNERVSNSETLIKKYGKPILQYSMEDDFIKEYPSVTIAQKKTGVIRQSIYSNLRGKHKQAGGFVFKYKGKSEKPKVGTYQLKPKKQN